MFFPFRDDVPTIRRPFFTVGLIAINALIFLFSIMMGERGFHLFTLQYGYIPYEFVTSAELTPEIAASSWFTPFSSMFMHSGWMHLIGNMLFLWIFGNNVEDFFGPVKFLLFYILSGLAAITIYTLFDSYSQVPLVGASGAIAGVMGAYMVLHPNARITALLVLFFIQFVQIPAKVMLGIWFAYQLLMSFAGLGGSAGGGVAWMAHVGGFLFGYVVMRIVVKIKGTGITPRGGQRVYRMNWN
ncbi:MAG: rhomboid family intramembrane serine protease [bacterium]